MYIHHPRKKMTSHDRSWWIMSNHDGSWWIMVRSWSIMTDRDQSWWIMMSHDRSWSMMIHHDGSWSIMILTGQQWSIMIDYVWKCWNTTKIRKIMIRYINIYRISCWSRFWWSKSVQNTSKVIKWRRNHEISIWPHESEYFFTEISKIAVPIRKTSTKRRKIDDFKMSCFFSWRL